MFNDYFVFFDTIFLDIIYLLTYTEFMEVINLNNENITITALSSVIYISKKFPPGNIAYYADKAGSAMHQLVFRVKGGVLTDYDGTLLYNLSDTVEYLPKGGGRIYKVETLETGDCIDIYFDTDRPVFDMPVCIKSKELRALFNQIYTIWLRKEAGYYYEAMSVLYKIIAVLKSDSELTGDYTPHYKKILPGINYLNENFFAADIDYTHAAKLCNMSYSYFRRIFLQCMKTSPAKYVMNKKIEYSKELLASGHYNVNRTAEAAGFKDVYYFSHVFKKLCGYSPNKYTYK